MIEDSVTHANQYGVLKECARCALPLKYTPRVGYVGYARAKRAPPQVVEAAQREVEQSGQPSTNTRMKAKIRELVEKNKQRAQPSKKEAKAAGLSREPPPQTPAAEEEADSEEQIPSDEDATVCYVCATDEEVEQCASCLRPTCAARHLRATLCPACRPINRSVRHPKAAMPTSKATAKPTARPSQAPVSETGSEASWEVTDSKGIRSWATFTSRLMLKQQAREKVWARLEETMTDAHVPSA